MLTTENPTTANANLASTSGVTASTKVATKPTQERVEAPEVQALIDAATPKDGKGDAYKDPLFAKVMSYEFPALIERVVDKEGWSEAVAQELFQDLKRFLYLCGTKKPGTAHLSPPELIDSIWHHYILHTKEYAKFCADHFQAFVHHTPFTRGQKQKMVGGGRPRESVERTQDAASQAFGQLSANWFAVGYDKKLGSLIVGYSECSGSTNCQSDVPCC